MFFGLVRCIRRLTTSSNETRTRSSSRTTTLKNIVQFKLLYCYRLRTTEPSRQPSKAIDASARGGSRQRKDPKSLMPSPP